MNVVSTSELRTKSKSMIKTLLSGGRITLIHRSKTVGEIIPKKNSHKIITPFDILEVSKIAKKLNLPKLSDSEIQRRYRKALLKRYGKGIS